jgi:hypothetical protein
VSECKVIEAARNGERSTLRSLLAAGANVNEQDEQGCGRTEPPDGVKLWYRTATPGWLGVPRFTIQTVAPRHPQTEFPPSPCWPAIDPKAGSCGGIASSGPC